MFCMEEGLGGSKFQFYASSIPLFFVGYGKKDIGKLNCKWCHRRKTDEGSQSLWLRKKGIFVDSRIDFAFKSLMILQFFEVPGNSAKRDLFGMVKT